MTGSEEAIRAFKFVRNGEAEPAEMDWEKGVETARQAISEAMNAKNIAFLLGAGCSSLMKGGEEVGISTMAPLATQFCAEAFAALVGASTLQETADDCEEIDKRIVSSQTQPFHIRNEDGAEVLVRPESAETAAGPSLANVAESWRLTRSGNGTRCCGIHQSNEWLRRRIGRPASLA